MDKHFVESPKSPRKISKEQLTRLMTKAGYLTEGEHIHSIWIDHSPLAPSVFNIRIGKNVAYEYDELMGVGHRKLRSKKR